MEGTALPVPLASLNANGFSPCAGAATERALIRMHASYIDTNLLPWYVGTPYAGKRPTENRPAAVAIAADRGRPRNRNPATLFLCHRPDGILARSVSHSHATCIWLDLASGCGCPRTHSRTMAPSAHRGLSDACYSDCSFMGNVQARDQERPGEAIRLRLPHA